MSISIIAGLGNPGLAYGNTRHNIGFMVLDALLKHLGGSDWKKESRFTAKIANVVHAGKTILLVKPLTYMNLSGDSIAAITHFYKIPSSQLAVVCDNINLEIGRSKLTLGGSAGGHNGLVSIIQKLGADFCRFCIGIGHKSHPEMDLADHVLGHLTADEKNVFDSNMPSYINGLLLLIEKGVIDTMNLINRK